MTLAATVTLTAPKLLLFTAGIVGIFALLWLLMSRVDRITMRQLYPPDPYRDGLPSYREPTPPPSHADLDRLPAEHIRRAGRELAAQRWHELEGGDQ